MGSFLSQLKSTITKTFTKVFYGRSYRDYNEANRSEAPSPPPQLSQDFPEPVINHCETAEDSRLLTPYLAQLNDFGSETPQLSKASGEIKELEDVLSISDEITTMGPEATNFQPTSLQSNIVEKDEIILSAIDSLIATEDFGRLSTSITSVTEESNGTTEKIAGTTTPLIDLPSVKITHFDSAATLLDTETNTHEPFTNTANKLDQKWINQVNLQRNVKPKKAKKPKSKGKGKAGSSNGNISTTVD
ncbi:hypothetical protein HDU99_001626 [Rhizoclosmatium hyalinum]|nr:hypothetical protein HDU99_001626 [Rhizoclosmatium hyalinum]